MSITKPNFERLQWADLLKIATLATLLLACLPSDSAVLQRGQKTFASPEEASKAFVAAAQNKRVV